jgi:hypothetical protein
MTDTIRAIQKQIVAKLEAGEDVSELTQQLARERAKIAAQAEVEQLQKIVEQRQALRDKADAVKVKIKNQGEAIDTLLKARDAITTALAPILEKTKDLLRLHDACFIEFHDAMVAGYSIEKTGGFLPDDLTIPMLQLGSGIRDPYDVSREALVYLHNGYGLLSNLRREEIKPVQPPMDPELDFGDNHSETIEGKCLVCLHPKAETINKLLGEGKPLRDLETEFNVSRSTLSRHKRNCLNLGAIRLREVEPTSPTASSNATYFHG